MDKENKGLIRQLGKLSVIGMEIVTATFVGLAIGVFSDRKLGTSPWLTIIFLILGIVAGFINLFRVIKKLDD